jgi:hypothetical protein
MPRKLTLASALSKLPLMLSARNVHHETLTRHFVLSRVGTTFLFAGPCVASWLYCPLTYSDNLTTNSAVGATFLHLLLRWSNEPENSEVWLVAVPYTVLSRHGRRNTTLAAKHVLYSGLLLKAKWQCHRGERLARATDFRRRTFWMESWVISGSGSGPRGGCQFLSPLVVILNEVIQHSKQYQEL